MSDKPTIREQIKALPKTIVPIDSPYPDSWQIDINELETYIRTHQLDLVDQFRDHIEGAYAAVEMAMGEAYYQMTQADKKGSDNE